MVHAFFRIFPDFLSTFHEERILLAWVRIKSGIGKKSKRNSSESVSCSFDLKETFRSPRRARYHHVHAHARISPTWKRVYLCRTQIGKYPEPKTAVRNWSVRQPQIRLLIRVPSSYHVISHLLFYKTRRKRSGSFKIFDFERNRAVDPFLIFFQEFVRFTAGIYEQRNHKGCRKNIILPIRFSIPVIYLSPSYNRIKNYVFFRTFICMFTKCIW